MQCMMNCQPQNRKRRNKQLPVCRTRSQQGLGQARPNKKLSQKATNFQELKICGHGTVLAGYVFHQHS